MVDEVEPASRWARFIGVIKDLGEIAKFGAVLLAVAGFLVLYVPHARRQLETFAAPRYWFYVGRVAGADFGRMRGVQLYHPYWSGGRVDLFRFFQLGGQVVYVDVNTAVPGRESAGTGSRVDTLLKRYDCLLVTDVQFVPFRYPKVADENGYVPTQVLTGRDMPKVVQMSELVGTPAKPASFTELKTVSDDSAKKAAGKFVATLPKGFGQEPDPLRTDKACVVTSDSDDLRKSEKDKAWYGKRVCSSVAIWAQGKRVKC